jgi:hypothetical protein
VKSFNLSQACRGKPELLSLFGQYPKKSSKTRDQVDGKLFYGQAAIIQNSGMVWKILLEAAVPCPCIDYTSEYKKAGTLCPAFLMSRLTGVSNYFFRK